MVFLERSSINSNSGGAEHTPATRCFISNGLLDRKSAAVCCLIDELYVFDARLLVQTHPKWAKYSLGCMDGPINWRTYAPSRAVTMPVMRDATPIPQNASLTSD